MKAMVMHEFGGREVLRWQDVPTPTPCPGEVLVKMAAVSGNATPAPWQISGEWIDRSVTGNASIRLYRPAGATEFLLESCGTPGEQLRTFLDGAPLPAITFSQPGCQNTRVPAALGHPRMLSIDFVASPAGQSVRISRLGFITAPDVPGR